jgi:hypothetical protein
MKIVENIVVAITTPTLRYQSTSPKVLRLTNKITPPVLIVIVLARSKVVLLFSEAIFLCFSSGAHLLSTVLVSQLRKVISRGTKTKRLSVMAYSVAQSLQ